MIIEITDEDLYYIAGRIKDGFTSGTTGDGEGHTISWELTIKKTKNV
jgi:hypothetical protein